MRLGQIEIENFRNLASVSLNLDHGTCAIIGKNAQGKTNLLEAMYVLALGKSFRVPKYREMISYEKQRSVITAQILGEGLPFELKMVLDAKEGKAIYKNGIKLQKLSDFLGLFRVVLFCPEHLSLVKDGPGKRRSFLDGAICQIRPYFASMLNEFNKIEAQRAALLKQAAKKDVPEELFSVWNERLAAISVKIACIRADYIALLKEKAPVQFSNIASGKESLQLRYVSDVYVEGMTREEMEKKYLLVLKESFLSDKKYGYTVKGVHRDDMEILVNEKSAKSFASQGQQRSVVLSLKLSEGEISKEMTGKDPVYLLDDVLSELDEERRSYITKGLVGKQVILTGTDEEDFSFASQKIKIEKGELIS